MNRLKAARRAKHMTQADVAEYIGLTQGAYSNWERGETKIDSLQLSRLAELFGVSVDYLLGKTDVPSSSYIRVPVLGRVAAGIPIDAIEDVIDWEDISTAAAGDGEYFGLQIKGHSMEPKISDGDVVIVRRQPDVDSGDIAVVLVNGDDATVKKVKKSPQGVTLIPSNPAYEPMYYSNKEIESLPVQILGRVVELRAKF